MVVLNVPNSRKSSTRGHALLSQRARAAEGDLLPAAGFRVRRSRCSHSPSRGSGQAVHQILPPMGTSTMIRAESQRTHTIIGPALRPATLVPNRPARMINQNTPSIGSARLN